MTIDIPITVAEQTALNGASKVKRYLSAAPLTSVASATIGTGGISDPTYSLPVTSTSNWSDIKIGMLAILRSSGGTIKARYRVRKTPAADTLYVNEQSVGDSGIVPSSTRTTAPVNGDIITIYNNYDLWSVLPRIVYSGGLSATIYEDYDASVGTFHTTPPPVVRIKITDSKGYTGRHLSTLVAVGGNETLTFTAEIEKWATSSGSTVTYAWTVPGTWSGTSGNTTATMTSTAPVGNHVVQLVVTDSIGGAFTCQALVWVHDEGTGATNPPILISEVNSDSIDMNGRRMSFSMIGDDLADIPDGAMVNYWEVGTWNNGVPSGNSFFHQCPGWLLRYSMSSKGKERTANPELVGPAGILENLGGYSQIFERASSASTWQETVPNLSNTHFWMYSLMYSRAGNLLKLFNYNPYSTSASSARMPIYKVDAGSLLQQLQSMADSYYKSFFGADPSGEFWHRRHPSLLESTLRSGLATRITLTEAMIAEDGLTVTRELRYRVRKVRGESFYSDGVSALPTPYLADAPGIAPGQGFGDASVDGQVLDAGQADLNILTGHFYQMQNNPYPSIRVRIPKNWPIFKPAQLLRVALSIPAAYMADGQALSLNCVLKSVTRQHNPDGTVDTILELEGETEGYPASVVPVPLPGSTVMPYTASTAAVSALTDYTPLVDWGGSFTYNPDSSMTLDPKPNATAEYGEIFGCTNGAYVWGWQGNGSGGAFADISPSEALRGLVGTPIRLVNDYYNYKKAVMLGTLGAVWTNDITATTPVWQAPARFNSTVTFDPGGLAYTLVTGSIAATSYWSTPIPPYDGYYILGTDTNTSVIEFNIPFTGSTNITEWSVKAHRNKRFSGGGMDNSNIVVKFYDSTDTLITTHTKLVNWGEDAWVNVSDTTDVSGVYRINVYWSQQGWFVTNRIEIAMDSFRVVQSSAATSATTPMSDFQPLPLRNGYAWLSYGTESSEDYVYYNATTDFFSTIRTTRIAHYTAGDIMYSFAVNPFDWRIVYVAAGTIADDDAGIYKSTDGGQSFAIVAALNSKGGHPWWNWSTGTANTKNKLESNMRHIWGLNGSNALQIIPGLTGSAVTIAASASAKYGEGPLALGFLARDLDIGWWLARDGSTYLTTNGGSTWTAKTSITGGTSFIVRGGWQFPSDSQFWLYFGYRCLGYTLNQGTAWSSLWSAYDTFRSSAGYGTNGETIVNCILNISSRYPVPPS